MAMMIQLVLLVLYFRATQIPNGCEDEANISFVPILE
jgi:hypothetical protein